MKTKIFLIMITLIGLGGCSGSDAENGNSSVTVNTISQSVDNSDTSETKRSKRYFAVPTEECEAFNNMRHSKNSHDVVLDTETKYLVYRDHKGQKLIQVKGEHPAQRWVDASCFMDKPQDGDIPEDDNRDNDQEEDDNHNDNEDNHDSVSQKNLLALSWHNAFCETHRTKTECKQTIDSAINKPYKDSHFVLHGLWPQPKGKDYCGVEREYITMDKHKQWGKLPSLDLSETTLDTLAIYMPGFASNLQRHEWYKHGTCYGKEADNYFTEATSFIKEINNSDVGPYFEENVGRTITLKKVQSLFDRSFGEGSGNKVEFRCSNGLVVELWLHLGYSENLSDALVKGDNTRSRCTKGILDNPGWRSKKREY